MNHMYHEQLFMMGTDEGQKQKPEKKNLDMRSDRIMMCF